MVVVVKVVFFVWLVLGLVKCVVYLKKFVVFIWEYRDEIVKLDVVVMGMFVFIYFFVEFVVG